MRLHTRCALVTGVHTCALPILRLWLDVDDAIFYDPTKVAIVPMGFCYPGKAGSCDAPPRPECRATWHPRLLPLLPGIRLTLLVGQYAQAYFLCKRRKASLTDTVRSWRAYMPTLLPLPPPPPPNVTWFNSHPRLDVRVLPPPPAPVRAVPWCSTFTSH